MTAPSQNKRLLAAALAGGAIALCACVLLFGVIFAFTQGPDLLQRLQGQQGSGPVQTLPPSNLGWSTSGTKTTGFVFDAGSSTWTFAWSCRPLQDTNGSLAVRFLYGSDSSHSADSGLQSCTGRTQSTVIGSVGTVVVELCEDDDFTTTPNPSIPGGPGSINCKSDAVVWSIAASTPPTQSNVGWG